MAQIGQLVVSVANIIIAIMLGVMASYIGVWVFSKSTRHLDDWSEVRRGNTAMGIVLGAIILGIAIILKPAVDLSAVVNITNPFLVLLGEVVGIVVGLVLAVSAIIFSIGMFGRMVGDIDELSELQRGNTAMAIILAAVILAVSWLISGAVASTIQWFTTFLAS